MNREDEVSWFQQTGHCGHCGNPGDYCTCTDTQPCGCRELHRLGSARDPDALAAFVEQPVEVSTDQGGLF